MRESKDLGWGWRHRRDVPEKTRQQGETSTLSKIRDGKEMRLATEGRISRQDKIKTQESFPCAHTLWNQVKSSPCLTGLLLAIHLSDYPLRSEILMLNPLDVQIWTYILLSCLPSLTIHLTAHTKQPLLNELKKEYLREYIIPWSKHQIIFTFRHI